MFQLCGCYLMLTALFYIVVVVVFVVEKLIAT